MTAWSLGFIFDKRLEWVCLMKKARTLHVGLWNGLGGRLEGDETPAECMARECKEETTNIAISPPFWVETGTIDFPNGNVVYVFATWLEDLRDHMTYTLKATADHVAQMKADEPRAVPWNYHLGKEIDLYELAPHAKVLIYAAADKLSDSHRKPLHIKEVVVF